MPKDSPSPKRGRKAVRTETKRVTLGPAEVVGSDVSEESEMNDSNTYSHLVKPLSIQKDNSPKVKHPPLPPSDTPRVKFEPNVKPNRPNLKVTLPERGVTENFTEHEADEDEDQGPRQPYLDNIERSVENIKRAVSASPVQSVPRKRFKSPLVRPNSPMPEVTTPPWQPRERPGKLVCLNRLVISSPQKAYRYNTHCICFINGSFQQILNTHFLLCSLWMEF